MSETTTSSTEPATGPVASPPPAQPAVRDEPRRSKVSAVAAWVGIVAGVVFIVAVIFFSGFILGKSTGGGPPGFGHHRGGPGPDMAIIHRGPPPGFGPHGGFERRFGPGGPGFGPGGQGPGGEQPGGPGAPNTTAPSRP